jgi:hypothetical protein
LFFLLDGLSQYLAVFLGVPDCYCICDELLLDRGQLCFLAEALLVQLTDSLLHGCFFGIILAYAH